MFKFIAIAAVVVVISLGTLFIVRDRHASEAMLIGVKHPNLGQQHLQTLDAAHKPYNSQLPSSGPHYVQPAPWGIKTETVVDEQLVHNEEHGGIIIAYKPDLAQDQLEALKQIASTLTANDSKGAVKGFKVLMFPRAKNEKPIQLASWCYTLDLEKVDAQLIQTFYRQHLNKAPEPEAQ